MTQIFEYTIFSDSDQEIEELEKAFETLEATRLNREGWTTAYGGKGVTIWVETNYLKKTIRQILKVTAAKLLKTRVVSP